MIEAKNLTKRFDQILAVDHINATIKDGSVFGLIGYQRRREKYVSAAGQRGVEAG